MESHTRGIGDLIQQKRSLQVPDHQRDFAWRHDEEVEQFFGDVVQAIESGADDYFLGLIVLVRPDGDGQSSILDGQQRLATTTMIYSAIRTWLNARGMTADINTIQSDYIGVRALGQADHRPRLTLNINNRDSFQVLVVNECADSDLATRLAAADRHSSERKLIAGIIACRKMVEDHASEGNLADVDQAARLFTLAEFLRDKANVVAMEVDSTSSAYMIFETLNDRGLDLSVLDLVKNHLFGRAGDRLDEVKASWAAMTANLGDRPADDFLKVWWTSRFGRIQRGKLFAEWRKKYDAANPSGIAEIARGLVVGADQYAALDAPDHDVWSNYSDTTASLHSELIALGHRQVRPLVMAAIEKFNEDRFERLLLLLRTLIMRYQAVGKGRTGVFEIAVAKAAPLVFAGSLSSPQAVWDSLGIAPSDAEFTESFLRYAEPKSARARYMLSQLETGAVLAATGSPPDLRPWGELTLEHVLPRNPSSEWDPELAADEDLMDLVHHIGNLCLLQDRLNRGVGNRGFAIKKPIYAASALTLTAELDAETTWGRQAIMARQERLASLAVAVWPLP